MITTPNDFETIYKFVQENAKKPELVRKNMELVRPIFENILSERWMFGKWIDTQEVMEATNFATGLDSRKIIPVSVSSISRLPRKVSIELHNDITANVNSLGYTLNRFRVDIHTNLYYNTRLNFMIMVDNFLGGNLHGNVQNSLDIGFMDKLKDDYARFIWLNWRKIVRGSLKIEMANAVASSIHATLKNFLVFILIGDTEKISLLTPIVRLLTQGVVPLCDKYNEPDSYLIAVT